MHRGLLGAAILNAELQALLNAQGAAVGRRWLQRLGVHLRSLAPVRKPPLVLSGSFSGTYDRERPGL
jgi:hypothetical protein